MLSYLQIFFNKFQFFYVLKKYSLTVNYNQQILSILNLLYNDGFIKSYKIINKSKVIIFFLYHRSLPFFKIKVLLSNDKKKFKKQKKKINGYFIYVDSDGYKSGLNRVCSTGKVILKLLYTNTK